MSKLTVAELHDLTHEVSDGDTEVVVLNEDSYGKYRVREVFYDEGGKRLTLVIDTSEDSV